MATPYRRVEQSDAAESTSTPAVVDDPDVADLLINIVWAAPAAESGNAIEISGQAYDANGVAYTSNVIDVELLVSDGAADNEPSATALLSAATAPVGTVLAGTGTATLVMQTNASGQLKIRVAETAASHRYLWTKAGGHAQRFIRARDGVVDLPFA